MSHCCSRIHTVLLMLVRSHSFSSLFITRPKLTHWRRKGSAENYETWSAWRWHTTAVVQREIKSKCVAKLSCNNWKEEKNCLTFKCRVWNVHKSQSKWISTLILTFLKCTLLQRVKNCQIGRGEIINLSIRIISVKASRRVISKQQQRVSVGLRKVVKEANILLHCIYVLCMLMVVKFASNPDHLRRELWVRDWTNGLTAGTASCRVTSTHFAGIAPWDAFCFL